MPDGWEVVRSDARSIGVSVPADTDLDRVLTELSAAGHIVDFSFGPPELSEVFLSSLGRMADRRRADADARDVDGRPDRLRDGGGPMTSPAQLAAVREIRTRVSRPSFMVFTALLCVAIIAGGFLFSVLNDDSRPSYDVGTVGATPELFEPALDFSADRPTSAWRSQAFDDSCTRRTPRSTTATST